MRCDTCGAHLVPEDGTRCASCTRAVEEREAAERNAAEAQAREAAAGPPDTGTNCATEPSGGAIVSWAFFGFLWGFACLFFALDGGCSWVFALPAAAAFVAVAAFYQGRTAATAAAAGLVAFGLTVGACLAAM